MPALNGEISPVRRSARLHMLMLLVCLGFLAMVTRLVSIQLIHHEYYEERADAQHTTSAVVEARRGRILDRNGYLLAGNRTVVMFQVYWPEVPEDCEASVDSLLVRLGTSALLDVPTARGSGNQILASAVPVVEALNLMGGIPTGVSFRVEQERTYPMGDMVAGIIGRSGPEGSEGLEQYLDDQLEGDNGMLQVEKSAAGRFNLTDPEGDNLPAVHGQDHMLTLDARFQCIVMEELEAAVEEAGGVWGAAVVLDPNTGAVLAAGSVPVRAENGALALNHCFQGYHEPGSTFKIVAYAACIEEGLLDPDRTFDCSSGSIAVPGGSIRDAHQMGILTADEVIIHSSNVGTVMLSRLLTDSLLYDYCREFGFGYKLMVGYPGESRGIVPAPGSSTWSGVSSAQIAIGQEVTVTPLHLALAFASIANGGSLYYPRLVAASWNGVDWDETVPIVRSHPVSPGTADTVRRTLTAVVEEGTGMSAAVSGVTIAGKTGTAERLSGETSYLSAFVGMVPAEDPALVVAVVIDGPDFEYRWGSASAAPAFSRMVGRILSVEPELALGRGSRAAGMLAEVRR